MSRFALPVCVGVELVAAVADVGDAVEVVVGPQVDADAELDEEDVGPGGKTVTHALLVTALALWPTACSYFCFTKSTVRSIISSLK